MHGMSPTDTHAVITILRQSRMDPSTIANINSPNDLMNLVKEITKFNLNK